MRQVNKIRIVIARRMLLLYDFLTFWPPCTFYFAPSADVSGRRTLWDDGLEWPFWGSFNGPLGPDGFCQGRIAFKKSKNTVGCRSGGGLLIRLLVAKRGWAECEIVRHQCSVSANALIECGLSVPLRGEKEEAMEHRHGLAEDTPGQAKNSDQRTLHTQQSPLQSSGLWRRLAGLSHGNCEAPLSARGQFDNGAFSIWRILRHPPPPTMARQFW